MGEVCVWLLALGTKGAHAEVMLGWCGRLWPPSWWGRAGLLFVTSGCWCCCCCSGGGDVLLPWVSWLDSWLSWSVLASDFSTAFSRSSTEFLSISSLICSFSTSTSSRTAYIRWLFTKSWERGHKRGRRTKIRHLRKRKKKIQTKEKGRHGKSLMWYVWSFFGLRSIK